MEYYENGFLEELLSLRSDSWEAGDIIPMGMGMNRNIDDDFYCYNNNYYYSNNNNNVVNNGNGNGGFDCVEEEKQITVPIIPGGACCSSAAAATATAATSTATTASFDDCYANYLPFEQSFNSYSPCFFNELYTELSPQLTESSNTKLGTPPPFPGYQEELLSSSPAGIFDEEANNCFRNPHSCKMEPAVYGGGGCEVVEAGVSFNIGSSGPEKKPKSKKLHGQPSKNLMAERRRRKRLNDRLSMLRSIVPKISKMDRTSILGDTIDYMKELLERINHLQEEMEVGPDQLRLMSIFKDVKPDELFVRNSPKFDVERREVSDTRVEICCSAKPGLLLSTVTTLEALGLEIQQCVISCFNDFAFRASCTQEMEQRGVLNTEDIKQALFRNAGYGGRCL
nr:transcription factor bHLH93-like [Ipomoea batatas]